MKVRFAAIARQELAEIGDHIAMDNRSAARRYVRAVTDHCASLSRFPNRYPAYPEFGTGVRKTHYRSHDIYYSVGPSTVLIERIVHSLRDASDLSFPDRS